MASVSWCMHACGLTSSLFAAVTPELPSINSYSGLWLWLLALPHVAHVAAGSANSELKLKGLPV